ncbi:MAG: GNAT family N-acetyltransferase [Candidatus Heimdallarchaeota archaeon]|nr:GNAT family N-acetyltransferase [Candidatus Heimdallarchaeota archaeon]
MKPNNKIRILPALEEHASDWTEIFLDGLKRYRWMMRYLKQQNISKYDVRQSFIQDIHNQTQEEQLLIAFYNNRPVGIIRFDKYFIPSATKILSHFPLVKQRFQRRGIGTALVKQGILNAYNSGYENIWAECWSLHQREISVYENFYSKIGFECKSKRYEMNCKISDLKINQTIDIPNFEIISNENITEEFTQAISSSYKESSDILHSFENLGDFETAKKFLIQTKKSFDSIGFIVDCKLLKFQNEICGALMTATSNIRGMILEIGILPDFRGKKFAKKAIIDYILQMKNKQAYEIILGVDSTNTPAISLYEKIGFIKTWMGSMLFLENKGKLNLE